MLYKLAIKNLKNNMKQYAMYFLSVAFNVCIYYVFLSIRFNEKLQELLGSDIKITAMFQVGNVMIFIFATLFIWYSTSFFLMRRKKEIGIYALLGVKRSRIGRLMFLETFVAGLISIAAGLLGGVLFGQLLLCVLAWFLGFGTSFYEGINMSAVLSTGISFIFIFFITAVLSQRIIYRYPLKELFYAEYKEEEPVAVTKTAGVTGVILLATGYISILRINSSANFFSGLMLGFLGIVSGTFLFYRHMMPAVCVAARNSSRFYTDIKNTATVSSILYRIRKNYRTWAMQSLLISTAAAVLLAGYSVYYTIEQTEKATYPFTFSYIRQSDEIEEGIDRLMVNQTENPVIEHVVTEELLVPGIKGEDSGEYRVISESSLRALEKASGIDCRVPALKPQQAAILAYSYAGEQNDKDELVCLGSGTEQRLFSVAATSRYNPLVLNHSDLVTVVSDDDYSALRNHYDMRSIVSYQNENEINSQGLTLKLQNLLPLEADLNYAYSMVPVFVYAKLLFFVMLFVAFVFASATGSIFCFKAVMEGEDDRENYRVYHQLGASATDLRHITAGQAGSMFFMPLILTAANLTALLAVMIRLELLHHLLPVLVSFAGIGMVYGIYYLISGQILRNIIMKGVIIK